MESAERSQGGLSDSGFGLSDAAMDVEECLPEGLPEGLPDEPNWPALAALPGSREV